MPRQVEAVYEQGVLRPLEPLPLKDNQRAGCPANPWKTGRGVALDGSRLVAHGEDLVEVRDAARAAGVDDPLFARIPRDRDIPFGGW
ncbi:MAG: DUF104 domain-containing protein [Acidobacteria bacterium]|nr:DUF104 domain-containing protein [Acidobacteriota bacterium]